MLPVNTVALWDRGALQPCKRSCSARAAAVAPPSRAAVHFSHGREPPRTGVKGNAHGVMSVIGAIDLGRCWKEISPSNFSDADVERRPQCVGLDCQLKVLYAAVEIQNALELANLDLKGS